MPNISQINLDLKRLLRTTSLQTNKNFNQIRDDIIKQYRIVLIDVNSIILKIASKPVNVPMDLTRLNNIRNDIEKVLLEMQNKIISKTSAGIMSSYSINYKGVGNAFKASANISFGAINKDMVAASVINKFSLVDWKAKGIANNSVIIQRVKNSVTQGIIMGSPIQTITANIQNHLGQGTRSALKIARTETHRAAIEGRLSVLDNVKESANRLGLEMKKIWLAASDEKVRESHANLNGVAEDKNGQFNLGGTMVSAPGMSGVPQEDINCRCDIITEFENL